MPNETFPTVVSSSWSELFICVCELQGLIAQTKEVTAVLYKHRTLPLSLSFYCVFYDLLLRNFSRVGEHIHELKDILLVCVEGR